MGKLKCNYDFNLMLFHIKIKIFNLFGSFVLANYKCALNGQINEFLVVALMKEID